MSKFYNKYQDFIEIGKGYLGVLLAFTLLYFGLLDGKIVTLWSPIFRRMLAWRFIISMFYMGRKK